MRGTRNKRKEQGRLKNGVEARGRRWPAELEAWASDRRAGYRRDMAIELLRGLPLAVKWVCITIATTTGGGLALAFVRIWPGFAA